MNSDSAKNSAIHKVFDILLLIGMIIAFPLGIIAAVKPGSMIDTIATFTSQLGVAVPDFWMAILLVLLFSTTLEWLPPSGYTPITENCRSSTAYEKCSSASW